MDEIQKHLIKLNYDFNIYYLHNTDEQNLNIKAELYLHKKYKEIFKKETRLGGYGILFELKYYFEKDKIMKSLSEIMRDLFPSINSFEQHNYYLTFELEMGSFVRFSGTKYENSSVGKLTWTRFFNSRLKSLIEIVQKHGLFGNFINIYTVNKPLKCILCSEYDWFYGIPGLYHGPFLSVFDEDEVRRDYPGNTSRFNQFLIDQEIDIVVYSSEVIITSKALSKFKITRYKINDKFLHRNDICSNNFDIEYKKYLAGMEIDYMEYFNISKICDKSRRYKLSIENILSNQVFEKYE
jgi:hypothetical protein